MTDRTTPTTGSRRRSLARRVAATVGGGALLVAAPVTAGAAQPDIQHFQGQGEHVEQELGLCLDVPFPIRHVQNFNARVKSFTGAGGLQRFSLSYENRGFYVNTDTGTSFDYSTVAKEGDARVTDNGDGTLTVHWAGKVTTVVHTPSGSLYGIDSERVSGVILVDHNGTPTDPGDDVVLSEELDQPTGVTTLGGIDDCVLAAELLG